MDNPSDERRSLPPWKEILKIGFGLLVFGAVFLFLARLDILTDTLTDLSPEPIALAGGAVVLVALTVIGVPLLPAALAGIVTWYLVQKYL